MQYYIYFKPDGIILDIKVFDTCVSNIELTEYQMKALVQELTNDGYKSFIYSTYGNYTAMRLQKDN